MEMLIILGFVIFAVFSIFGAISMIKQINKLPNMGTLGSKPKTQTDYANEHKKPNPKQQKNGKMNLIWVDMNKSSGIY